MKLQIVAFYFFIISLFTMFLLTLKMPTFMKFTGLQKDPLHNSNLLNQSQRKPVILAWTSFFGMVDLALWLRRGMHGCPYDCDFKNRTQSNEESADAVVFHIFDLNMRDLPQQRRSKQYYVYYNMESPVHIGSYLKTLPRDFFNATLGYLLQPGSYFHSYGKFYPIDEQLQSQSGNWTVVTEDQILAAINQKSHVAYALISNCHTNSKREEYIQVVFLFKFMGGEHDFNIEVIKRSCTWPYLHVDRALSKNYPITWKLLLAVAAIVFLLSVARLASGILLVSCLNLLNPMKPFACLLLRKKKNSSILPESHFFFLAFENAVCKDYASEKFFRIQDLIVPVVLKRSVLKGIAPDSAFVAADDFSSPQELADFLVKTSKNLTRYLEFFEWTKRFYIETPEAIDGVCNLCRDLRFGNVSSPWPSGSPDIYEYYTKKQCDEGFGARLARHPLPRQSKQTNLTLNP